MPLLREMTERVLSRWERLRRHYFEGVAGAPGRAGPGRAPRLLDAIGRRDPDGAEQVVRAHTRAAQAAYADFLHGMLRSQSS